MLPILDYADFLVESAPIKQISLLDKIQERAVKQIRFGVRFTQADPKIEKVYNIVPLRERRRKHHLSLMYRIRDFTSYLDIARPAVNLRSNNKIKFCTPRNRLTKVLKGPFYRGVSLWDRLTVRVQRATTKVRFKQLIA